MTAEQYGMQIIQSRVTSRAAFKEPERVPSAAKDPSATLFLLRNLANAAGQESLKRQIAETIAYVQAL
jgi:hypothetical protein